MTENAIFQPSRDPLTIALLVLPQASILEVASALDPLRNANRQLGHEAYRWRVVSPDGTPVPLTCGIELPSSGPLAHAVGAEALITVAGYRLAEVATRPLIHDLRRIAPRFGLVGGIDAAAEDEAAVRRWSGYLSLPLNFTLGLKLLWESADALWRWAGDTATDENHYSKRAILSGILATALAIRLSSGREAAMTFVDARIENVMSFEKWKAGLKPADLMRDVAAALGKMRYG